jgi:hypothetical protein
MPAKINMFISNGNATPQQIQAIHQAYLAPVPKAPSALSAPIISRIHNVRPGCGSCGRK